MLVDAGVEDEAGAAVVAHAFRQGVTFFDTSDYYGPLNNEILLGKVSCFSFLPSFLFLRLSYSS